MAGKTVRATTSFLVTVGKAEHFVHEGDTFPSANPVVKANPAAFEPVEQATEKAKAVGLVR